MKMNHKIKLFLAGLFIAGGIFLTSCGGGNRNHNNDSTSIGGTDTASATPDTAASEIPPGAINPGEDSSRYGTGTGDSSRNRNPQ